MAGEHRHRGGRGQLRQDRGRHRGARRRDVARQLPVCDYGRNGEYEGDDVPQRRRDCDVQLAGADGDRPPAEAGSAGAGEQDPRAAVAGRGDCAAVSEKVVGDRLELSGTSMSSAVVAGAAALLLEARPKSKPEDIRLALQLGAEQLPGFGVVQEGAGSLNVLASLAIAETGDANLETSIAGESIATDGIAFTAAPIQGDHLHMGRPPHVGRPSRVG